MQRTLKKNTVGIWMLVLAAIAFAPKSAMAESDPNPFQFITQLGQMGFAQGGGVFMPSSVLQAMHQGQVSLSNQYVLANSLFNQCMKDLKRYTPNPRDPFTVARSKFNYGVCRITACQKQAMLLLALPMLSNNPAAGGAAGQGSAVNAQFAQALAQSFGQSQSCGGQGPAINPALLALILGQM